MRGVDRGRLRWLSRRWLVRIFPDGDIVGKLLDMGKDGSARQTSIANPWHIEMNSNTGVSGSPTVQGSSTLLDKS